MQLYRMHTQFVSLRCIYMTNIRKNCFIRLLEVMLSGAPQLTVYFPANVSSTCWACNSYVRGGWLFTSKDTGHPPLTPIVLLYSITSASAVVWSIHPLSGAAVTLCLKFKGIKREKPFQKANLMSRWCQCCSYLFFYLRLSCAGRPPM